MSGALFAAISGAYSSGPVIKLTSPVAVSFASGGVSTASTGYRAANDGFIYTAAGASLTFAQQEQWDSQPATVGEYDIRVTVNSGTTPAGSATGSWLNLASTRTWTLTAAIGTTRTCDLTVEIRSATTLAVLATASVTLTSEAT